MIQVKKAFSSLFIFFLLSSLSVLSVAVVQEGIKLQQNIEQLQERIKLQQNIEQHRNSEFYPESTII